MICQRCQQNPATVQVTEIAPDAVFGLHGGSGGADGADGPDGPDGPNGAGGSQGPQGIIEHNLCAICAQSSDLPHQPLSVKKSPTEIWNLLQVSARRARAGAAIACPNCGMTLAEFRQRGRLGCSKCYEAFAQQLEDLCERIHGAVQHVGRLPGLDEADLERRQRVTELERELETAIRAEAYESAARIRDELNGLKQR